MSAHSEGGEVLVKTEWTTSDMERAIEAMASGGVAAVMDLGVSLFLARASEQVKEDMERLTESLSSEMGLRLIPEDREALARLSALAQEAMPLRVVRTEAETLRAKAAEMEWGGAVLICKVLSDVELALAGAEGLQRAYELAGQRADAFEAEVKASRAEVERWKAEHSAMVIQAKDARHAQRDALAEVERLKAALGGAEDRGRLLFDAKNHWAERARAAESRLAAIRERAKSTEEIRRQFAEAIASHCTPEAAAIAVAMWVWEKDGLGDQPVPSATDAACEGDASWTAGREFGERSLRDAIRQRAAQVNALGISVAAQKAQRAHRNAAHRPWTAAADAVVNWILEGDAPHEANNQPVRTTIIHRAVPVCGRCGRAPCLCSAGPTWPCSTTCSHSDAETPGHPERVRLLSGAFAQGADGTNDESGPDPVKERSETIIATTSPMSLAHGYVRANDTASLFGAREEAPTEPTEVARREGFNEGAEAMRAACLDAVQAEKDELGLTSAQVERLKAAIRKASP